MSLEEERIRELQRKDKEHDARLEKLEKLCADLTARIEALEAQLKK